MRAVLSILVVAAALVGAASLVTPEDAYAQKSTIQGSHGGGGGGGGLRSGGGSSRGGIARPSTGSGSRGGVARASSGSRGRATLSPGFPRRGTGGSDAIASRSPSSSGRLGRVARPSGRVRDDGDGSGKRFLRGGRNGHDGWRHSHHHDDDDVTFIVGSPFWYSPYFYDPFLRYRYYDRWRYAFGFGCGFYDRYWHGYGGWGGYPYGGYDPCFSSFSFYLGFPWFSDPWPGFWSWGGYGGYGGGYGGYGGGYGGEAYDQNDDGGDDGYDEGYARGYRDGLDARTPAPSYEAQYDAAPAADAGLPLDPAVRRHLAAGDYEAALDELDRLIDEYPNDPAAQFARGITLAALGHYEDSAEALRAALDAGGPARLTIDAPALFPSRAEFRRTVTGLESYVRSHADERDARFTLGALYVFSGEIDAGRALLRGLGDDRHARDLLERTGLP